MLGKLLLMSRENQRANELRAKLRDREALATREWDELRVLELLARARERCVVEELTEGRPLTALTDPDLEALARHLESKGE